MPECQGSVRPILQGMVSQKVYMKNDANTAAWGEYICMTEKPESMVMITLGTSVGGSIIQSGRLVKGINYASGEALANQARKKMGKKPGSLMWELCGGNLERMEGRFVFDAVRQGDKAAAGSAMHWRWHQQGVQAGGGRRDCGCGKAAQDEVKSGR